MPNQTPEHTALTRAAEHAFAWLDGLDSRSVATTASVAELRARLTKPLADRGLPATRVIDELVADTAGGILGSQSGRFFSWVIGGGLPAAMAADWLTTVWDQNAGIHACGPAASVVEEVAADWLREMFDFPAETSVGFTTGTQMAHMTCLAAARHALLRDRGWDVERKGLAGAPPIRVLANADRHGSVDRAVRFVGIGSDAIVPLPVDSDGRVTPETLSAAIAASPNPTIVVLQAGELNRATFDPFEGLAPIARAAGAWTHVDGAFGLWAKASPRHRDLVRGLELCDSWTTDAHKYLNVPYDSGLAFVRDAEAHRAAMTLSTSYLPAGAARDQIDWNPEFSRRARGFALYAALRELGRDGLAELVERTCRHAQAIVTGIGALPDAVLVANSGLNQGLVRFRSGMAGATEADHDRRTDEVIAAINATGEAFFGGVTWRGRRCMRVSVCNWRTSEADAARAVAAVRTVLALEMVGGPGRPATAAARSGG
jgi:glutamate/tyrosine decarboxylase-like PLP-dependent enzyme